MMAIIICLESAEISQIFQNHLDRIAIDWNYSKQFFLGSDYWILDVYGIYISVNIIILF